FVFEPSSGEIPVGESIDITASFNPNELGDFYEVFHCQLTGSTSTVPLVFKGRSVAPSFTFDVEAIDFGLVSVGFLNTKTITLTNTSDVSFNYVLRVPGDGRLDEKEFDLVPSRGSLKPLARQRIQVDLIAENVRSYELSLLVDLEGIGEGLLAVPISGRSDVPSISFEPVEVLSFGEVFIHYPFHKRLILHNTSTLPAKFDIITDSDGPADSADPSVAIAEVEPDQPQGRVPAASSHVVTLTLYAKRTGSVNRTVYIKIGGHSVPYPITVKARAVGPRVLVEPMAIDWGSVRCLDVVTKTIKLTNDCCIAAPLRVLMKSRTSPWTVEQKVIHLEPQEVYHLSVKLRPNEVQRFTDVLYVIVEEGEDSAINFKCRGTETPIVCDQDLGRIDFGTQYTTQSITKEIVLKNLGRKSRTITWLVNEEAAREKVLKQLAKDGVDLKKAKLPAVPYTIHPTTAVLPSNKGYRFTVTACSQVIDLVEDTAECIEYVGGNKKGKAIFQPSLKTTFVAPLLRMSDNNVPYRYVWSKEDGEKAAMMTRPLKITNISPLPITFSLKVPVPFYIRLPQAATLVGVEGVSVAEGSVNLDPEASATVEVDFDPSYKVDRQCAVLKQNISITYRDHPQKDSLEAIGEVVFPNLSFERAELDFGAVLNRTVTEKQVLLNTISPNMAFDIEPIAGTIPAHTTETVCFRFNGIPDRLCEAVARCNVIGGQSYDVMLRGRASELSFRIDKTHLDFGNMQFDNFAERELVIVNKSCVTAFFAVDLRGLKRRVLTVTPEKGKIHGDGKAKLTVNFSPGIPSEVSEVFLIRVSHLPAVAVSVEGCGVYPALVLNLPRANAEEHMRKMEDIAERMPVEVHHTGTSSRGTSRRASFMSTTPVGSVILSEHPGTSKSGDPRSSGAARSHKLAGTAIASMASRRGSSSELGGVAPPHTVVSLGHHTLKCTVEVDRASLCDALLAIERLQDAPASMTPSGRKKARALTAKTVAGSYVCDFGDIVLGHSRRQPFTVYNCHATDIMLNISRKELMEAGFIVTPEQVGSIAPGKFLSMAIITELPKEAEEGVRELLWELPIKNGPRYAIHLRARHEIPQLTLPINEVDFGTVVVGLRSKRYLRLINDKHVPVEWSFRVPTTKFGVPLPPWEVPFGITPTFGMLEPGQDSTVEVSFAPNAAGAFAEKFALRIKDNRQSAVISLRGSGSALEVNITPTSFCHLGPVLPYQQDPPCRQELTLENPTDHPIEIYSVEFDTAYVTEEEMLREYDGYDEYSIAEMPMREVGSSSWPRLVENVEKARAKSARAAQRLEVEGSADDETAEGENTIFEPEEDDDLPEQREEDYPNRVPPSERLSIILLGPPKTGKTTVARALGVEHLRKHLTVDDCIEWIISNPKSLRDDYVAEKLIRKVRDAISECESESREGVPDLVKADVVATIRYRLDLPDCNAGVVWDDCSKASKYVAEDSIECISEALPKEESLKFILFDVEGGSDEGWSPETALAAYYSRLEELLSQELQEVTESLAESERQEQSEAEEAAVDGGGVAPNDVEQLARAELSVKIARRKKELEGLLQWFEDEKPATRAGQYVEELSALVRKIRGDPVDGDDGNHGDDVVESDDVNDDPVGENAAVVTEAQGFDTDSVTPRSTTWLEVLLAAEQSDARKVTEQVLASVAQPAFPAYSRLPHPKTVQLVRKPMTREPRAPSELFMLLTPVENDEGAEEFLEQTRWVIPARSEQRIAVQFYATKAGTFSEQLRFEIVSSGLSPVQTFVDVSGTAGFPKINNDPRNVFMRRMKNRPRGGYPKKQFIVSQSVFDFGPLLAGRTTEMRDALLALEQDDQERLAGERLLRQHAETLRITNNSLFRAEVRCVMASTMSAGPGQPTETPDDSEDFPSLSLDDCPFVIDPSQFTLDQDETMDVQLWCFPQREGQFRDTLAVLVKDNPEVFKWGVEAIGAVPKADLDTDVVDFGSLMVRQRDTRTIHIQNAAAAPVEWELLAADVNQTEESEPVPPQEILIEPMGGRLGIGESSDINVTFYAEDPVSHDFVMNMLVRDCEGLGRFAPEPRPVHFKAQSFKVQVSVVIPGDDEAPSNVIDFGDIRVGQVAERSFELTNDGEHAVDHSLVVRGKKMRKLLSVDPARSTLEPGQRQTVKAALVCPRAMSVVKSPEIFMKLVESRTKEEVKPEMPPFRISADAQFNRVTVSPSAEIDFGPLVAGETASETIKVTNDGVFEIPWSLFDLSKPPETPRDETLEAQSTLSVGPFNVAPASGTLPPGETAEVTIAFDALEENSYSSKLGLLVEGTESGEPLQIRLSGESYIPGIDTENMHLLFEEQFTSRTREDAEAIVGSADLRVYCEDEKLFSYGPIVTTRSVTERFRLSNPTGITVDVECKLEDVDKDTPFTLSPPQLSIPPFEYRYVTMTFSPQEVGTFDGRFSAVVPKGTDPSTNSLSFNVKGEGVVPSLELKAPAFTSIDSSTLGFDFGELPIGASREVSLALTNEHRTDATYRLERSGSGMRSFSVTGPVNGTLKPGETRHIRVSFVPVAASDGDEFVLRLVTVHNDNESRLLKLNGRGVTLPAEWVLPRGTGEIDGAYNPHDLLDIGDIPIGSEKQLTLGLRNVSGSTHRFEMVDIADPQLRGCIDIMPSAGHVPAGETKTLRLRMRPTDKMILEKATLLFSLVAIDVERRGVPWDNLQQVRASASDDAATRPEPPYAALSDAAVELPLKLSARSDSISYVCSQEERVVFSTTVLYHARQHIFVLENASEISFDYSWRLVNAAAAARSTAHRAFTVVRPQSGTLQARTKLDVALRFSPTEVCDFSTVRLELMLPQKDEATPAMSLALDASATCPVCHFEILDCPTLPGRDDVRIIEFESLGTGVRNRRRFSVLNTTKERYRFFWVDHRQALPDGCATDDAAGGAGGEATAMGGSLQPFGCVTRDGEIASGKKYEMELLYTPMSYGRHESFWTFRVPSQNLVVPFQFKGVVREPRVDVDSPSLNFGKVLVNYETRRTVNLVNREHLPFQFVIDSASWFDNALSISPMKGVVSPGGKLAITVTFKPSEEKLYNFNIIANVKRKAEPVVLNVKGSAYKIKSTMTLLAAPDAESGQELFSKVPANHDFGSLQVPSNPRMGLVPPYVRVSPTHGSAAVDEPTLIEVEYSPPDTHILQGTTLKVLLVGGSGPGQNVYTIDLSGSSRRPAVDLSFTEKDFGPTFMLQSETSSDVIERPTSGYFGSRADLVITNRDAAVCGITAAKLEDVEEFIIDLPEDLEIGVGESFTMPIIFAPRELSVYTETLELTLNGCTKMNLRLKGRGVPLYLETESPEMQVVDFGHVSSEKAQTVVKDVVLVNRSAASVTFTLADLNDNLSDKYVSWQPTGPVVLKRREKMQIRISFCPESRFRPFLLPLYAKLTGPFPEEDFSVRVLNVKAAAYSSTPGPARGEQLAIAVYKSQGVV
ncbi:hypothetical protein FOL46_008426, partial [Perkinsus olseni]